MPSLPVEATQVPGLRGGKVVSRCPAIGSSRGPPAVKTRRGSKNLVRPPTENPEEPVFSVIDFRDIHRTAHRKSVIGQVLHHFLMVSCAVVGKRNARVE